MTSDERTAEDRLSLGLLLDEPAMERWAVDAVETAMRETGVSVELILLEADEEARTANPVKRYATAAREYGAWTPALALHRLVNTPAYLEKTPLEDLEWAADAEIRRTRAQPAEGFGQRLPAAALERIDALDIDLLFRRGFGILQGDVLTTPSEGVLSFHHGDVRRYRGRPTAVWEFANGESTAGITLQRLTPQLDGGEIVVEKSVDVADCRTWQEVERRLFERSTDMLATACTRLEDSAFEPTSVDELGPLYSDPGAVDAARIELKNAKGRVLNAIDR